MLWGITLLRSWSQQRLSPPPPGRKTCYSPFDNSMADNTASSDKVAKVVA